VLKSNVNNKSLILKVAALNNDKLLHESGKPGDIRLITIRVEQFGAKLLP
jgi:hypothetical protein